jgi:hypothetical protein
VCCRDEDLEEEAEEEEAKWWKNVEAEEGRCSLHSGVASMIDAILPAIQPCSNVVDGKGTSGWLYCTKVGAALTAAIEPRYAAADVLRAEVNPKPPKRRGARRRSVVDRLLASSTWRSSLDCAAPMTLTSID